MIPQSDAKSIMGKLIDGQPPDQHTVKYDAASGKVLWVEIGTGPQGPAGADGADGADGTNGLDGTNGANGADGVDAWNFRGEWADASTYVINDGVTRGGSSFRCYLGHTASSGNAPAYDPDTDTITNGGTYWELVAGRGLTGAAGADGADGTDGVDGTTWNWRGNWSSGLTFAADDGTYHESATHLGSYICISAHTSAANNEPRTGVDWADVWDAVIELDKGLLVTGGDSHDHSGGDGAQIDHTTLSNIGTANHSDIDTFIAKFPDPTTWAPTAAWDTTAPADVTEVYEYCRTNRRADFWVRIYGADGDGKTLVSIPLPVEALDCNIYGPVIVHVKVDTTWNSTVIHGYVDMADGTAANRKLYFHNMPVLTDAVAYDIRIHGTYLTSGA